MLKSMMLLLAVNAADFNCLWETVYHETRGLEQHGAALVADTIINRVLHPSFPDSICEVVQQPHQYAYGFVILEPDSAEQSRRVAAEALKGPGNREILFFFVDSYGIPAWAEQLRPVTRAGNHLFLTLED